MEIVHSRKRELFTSFVSGMTIILFIFTSLLSASAADLELDDRSGCVGGLATFTLYINNAPDEVASLGVDIGFDSNVLQYDSVDFSGTLLEGFDFKDVNVPETGVLRLGAFEAGGDKIVQAASGAVAKITFNVIGDQNHSLPLSQLKDDVAGWSTRDGSFSHLCFAIDPPAVTLCEGASVTFTVVPPNMGIPPFTWRIDDEIVQTGDSRTFEYRFLVSENSIIRVDDSSVPALFAEAEATVSSEVDDGAIDILPGRGNNGDRVTIPVQIQNAPNAVGSLGFEVVFDPAVFAYNWHTRGDLVTHFDFFDVNQIEPGLLRIGGFEAGADILPAGASGILVELTFDVVCEVCISSFLEPQELKDDIAPWNVSGGCFLACCGCDGDVNRDGEITPIDALCSFEKYLLICPTTCGIACEDVCCDVNQDDECTPADALCIFRKYLMQPSCLD